MTFAMISNRARIFSSFSCWTTTLPRLATSESVPDKEFLLWKNSEIQLKSILFIVVLSMIYLLYMLLVATAEFVLFKEFERFNMGLILLESLGVTISFAYSETSILIVLISSMTRDPCSISNWYGFSFSNLNSWDIKFMTTKFWICRARTNLGLESSWNLRRWVRGSEICFRRNVQS